MLLVVLKSPNCPSNKWSTAPLWNIYLQNICSTPSRGTLVEHHCLRYLIFALQTS